MAVLIAGTAAFWGIERYIKIRAGNATVDRSPLVKLYVEFTGLQISNRTVATPFRVGSGSLNVGCDETRAASVSFTAPAGSIIVSADAAWSNLDGVASVSQSATHSETSASAQGILKGRDRTWIGDCPGGGHGELSLFGSTSMTVQDGSGKHVLLKSEEDVLSPGTTLGIRVPTEALEHLVEVTINIDDPKRRLTMKGAISRDREGNYTLKGIEDQKLLRVELHGDLLLVKLLR